MRIKNIFISPFVLALAVSGCKQHADLPPLLDTQNYFEQYVQSKKLPVIKGKILNLPDSLKKRADFLTLTIYTIDVDGKYDKAIPLSADGSFELKPDYALPFQKLELSLGEDLPKSIYVTDDLEIEIDYRRIPKNNSVTYKGTDSGLNEFMDSYGNFTREYNAKTHYRSLMQTLIDKDTLSKGFIPTWEKLSNARELADSIFFTQNNRSKKYKWVAKQEAQAQKYYDLLSFHTLRGLEIYNDTLWANLRHFKPRYLDLTVGLFYNDLKLYENIRAAKLSQKAFIISLYQSMLNAVDIPLAEKEQLKRIELAHIQFMAAQKAGNATSEMAAKLNTVFKPLMVKYSILVNKDVDQWKKEHAQQNLFTFIRKDFTLVTADILSAYNLPNHTQVGVDEFAKMYKEKLPLIKSTLVKKYITDYTKRVADLPGNVTDFDNAVKEQLADSLRYTHNTITLHNGYTLNYNNNLNGGSIVKQLQQDHEGKALLIDMWGTWCVPCINDFETTTEFKSQIDTNKVVFVYLCNNSPVKDWAMRVAKHKLKGINILLSPSQTNELFVKFRFTGFPSYLLIDKNGGINYSVGELYHLANGAEQLNALARK